MALVACHEYARTGSVDNQGHRTYVRSFKVTTDDPQDGPYLVMTAPGIVWGDPYVIGSENDPYAYARDFNSRLFDEDNSKKFWVVNVTYTSKPEPAQYTSSGGLALPTGSTNPPTPQANVNPPDRSWRVAWTTTKIKTVMYRDQGDGRRIVSSNGLKYGTPFEAEHVVPVCTIQAWKDPSTYDLYLAKDTWINTVNDDVWQGFDEGTVKCEDLDGEILWEQGAWWMSVKLTLHFAARTMVSYVDYATGADLVTPEITWDEDVMNTGLKELVAGEHRTILDKFNKPVSEPHPLAANGTKLTIPAYPATPAFSYKRYRRFPWEDWTNII